jgi:hypothetical protein
MLYLFSIGKPGHFEDVTEKAGLQRTLEPTVDADRMDGGVDVRYYGVFNTGLLKDILPGPFKLTAMFTDLDNDGKLYNLWFHCLVCKTIDQMFRSRSLVVYSYFKKGC